MAHPAYKYDLGLTDCRPNPLRPYTEDRIEAMTQEHEREIVCHDREHFKAMLRMIDGHFCKNSGGVR